MILIQNTTRTPNLSQSGKRDQSIGMKENKMDKTNTFKWQKRITWKVNETELYERDYQISIKLNWMNLPEMNEWY